MCFQLCVDLLYSQVYSSLVTVSMEGKRRFFPSWEGSLKRVILLLPMEVAKRSSLVFLCSSDSEDWIILIKDKLAWWSLGKLYTSVTVVMNLRKISQNISHLKKKIHTKFMESLFWVFCPSWQLNYTTPKNPQSWNTWEFWSWLRHI